MMRDGFGGAVRVNGGGSEKRCLKDDANEGNKPRFECSEKSEGLCCAGGVEPGGCECGPCWMANGGGIRR